MATSVNCTPGWGASDGKTINSRQTRQSGLSTFDLVGGASPLANGYGVLPTLGSPLGVTQAATPAMKVTVIAGKVAVPNNTAGEPGYGLTLEANTDLDIATSNVTNPRIDLVIARVVDLGNSGSTYTVEILTGTPAAVPSRPTLPSGTSHCIALKTITVGAGVTSILNANITTTQSDTWTTATSDAQYLSAPGGCKFHGGLVTMSTTRRQAWAAQFSPGTPWWDQTNRVFGVTNGADIVPLSIRKLYESIDAATVQTSSTSPVTAVNSGTLSVFGGTRRIKVTATGKLNCNGSADTRWMAARAFLIASGTITGVSGGGTQAHARMWGASSSPTTVSQHSFTLSRVFEAGTGSFSVQLQLLRVDAGGTGTGDTVQLVDGGLLVEDIGPA